jgi:hypothetical protein
MIKWSLTPPFSSNSNLAALVATLRRRIKIIGAGLGKEGLLSQKFCFILLLVAFKNKLIKQRCMALSGRLLSFSIFMMDDPYPSFIIFK